MSPRYCRFSCLACHPIEHVGIAWSLLPDSGNSLKLKKCRFFTGAIDYLVHVIRPRGLEIVARITNAIKRFKEPTNFKELRLLPGLCNKFHCFVSIFACIAVLFNRKLKNDQRKNFDASSADELKLYTNYRTNRSLNQFWCYRTLEAVTP